MHVCMVVYMYVYKYILQAGGPYAPAQRLAPAAVPGGLHRAALSCCSGCCCYY